MSRYRQSYAGITMRMLHHILMATGEVTVLLFAFAWHGNARAEEADGSDLLVLQFTCEFRIPMGRGCLYGLMASDGTCARIATYWIEPTVFRESSALVRSWDLILDEKMVRCWIYGMVQTGTFPLTNDENDPLLPQSNSPEAVIRSSLAVMNRIRQQSESMDVPLVIGKFFHESRGQGEYSYKALPEEADSNDLPETTPADMRVLNTLPHGRCYSKQRQSDGAIVWSVQKATNDQPVVAVTVRPAMNVQRGDCPGVFDPNTLGQWTLVPDAYRMYWLFDRAYCELRTSSDETRPRELYERIDSYLADTDVSAQLRQGMDRLRFKTAAMTNDANLVHASAQASAAGLCQHDSADAYECLLELARISGQIEKQYPRQAEEWLRPLVEQTTRHLGPNVAATLDRLLPTITANGWFTYGILLLDELRRQDVVDQRAAEAAVAQLHAKRMARTRLLSDSGAPPASILQYLEHLDATPPRGTLDMNDVRQIIEEGLAKHYREDQSKAKRELVDDVLQSIRLIVGEGPFRGDREQLTESLAAFSWRYIVVEKRTEPLDTVLATLLALSFCDLSTMEDHNVLLSQFHRCSVDMHSQVDTMLNSRGLNSMVTVEDIDHVFEMYERIFHRYVGDPLWPAFKFPLSDNEEAKLAGEVKLRSIQLELALDEIALKVKYGDTNVELKARAIEEISRMVQSVLPEIAFLRNPPYPGVSCQYHGGSGFITVMKGPLYLEGDRPREKFKAMKYFHLGHRLEDIVERERELARISETQESNQ